MGADTSQLPPEAIERAERESYRFSLLTEDERAAEIGCLSKAKKVKIIFFFKFF